MGETKNPWGVGSRNGVPRGILGLCRLTLLFVRLCRFVHGSERGRRGIIIYPLTYRLCLIYTQRLYKLLRKLSMKNNNNSPRSPPVVSTFSPLENPLGPQILPGKGWEGAGRCRRKGTLEQPIIPPVLLSSCQNWILYIYIYMYIFLLHMFFFIHITTSILYI